VFTAIVTQLVTRPLDDLFLIRKARALLTCSGWALNCHCPSVNIYGRPLATSNRQVRSLLTDWRISGRMPGRPGRTIRLIDGGSTAIRRARPMRRQLVSRLSRPGYRRDRREHDLNPIALTGMVRALSITGLRRSVLRVLH
jgi:hypothetical protein